MYDDEQHQQASAATAAIQQHTEQHQPQQQHFVYIPIHEILDLTADVFLIL